MSLANLALRHSRSVLAAMIAVGALGLVALFRMPTDLFPDTVPPQVMVMTVRPGASADDMTDSVTRVLEKELATIPGLLKVASTGRDEVSSIQLEFDYSKPLGEAVLDAQNAIGRVRALLPADVMEPRIYRVTDATRPLATIALSPRQDSRRGLAEIRLLAENDLKDELLTLPGIADVEIFGGHTAEIQVLASRDKLMARGLTLDDITAALAQSNISMPAGTIYTANREHTVMVDGQFDDLEAIRNLPLRSVAQGSLRLSDVAVVKLSRAPLRSIYHGNGLPAIAVNVMRAPGEPAVPAIRALKSFLPLIEARHPDLLFEIADDQQPLIDINIRGMRESLLQAMLITSLVILVFLGDLRAAAVVSVSIPLSFLGSLLILQQTPHTLNMVTLTGLIIAVGMVVDASVVVLENIHRHWKEAPPGTPAREIALNGVREISIEITAGMLTTVAVLLPVMATTGYTGRVMRPLNLMIISTLVLSLLAALTVVPMLAGITLKSSSSEKPGFTRRLFLKFDARIERLADWYAGLAALALRHKALTLLLAALVLAGTMRTVPRIVGGELMPPMDTGISQIEFETPPDSSPDEAERILSAIEEIICCTEGVLTTSATLGSEPGVLSFGGGGATLQTGKITVRLVDRTRRSKSIWEIQDQWRQQLRLLAGVRSLRVNEFGATPMSTTKAPLNILIEGPDTRVVSRLGDECLDLLEGLPGLFDLRRSWRLDREEQVIVVDPDLARLHGTSPASVADTMHKAVRGVTATRFRLASLLDVPVVVRYDPQDIAAPEAIGSVYIPTAGAQLPLRALAKVESRLAPSIVTREQLRRTLDLTGVNRGPTIKHLAAAARKRLAGLRVPEGYRVTVGGSMQDMMAAQKQFARALLTGLILLYVLLVAMLNSWRQPVIVLSAIPLAVASGMWGLMLFHKPMCQPAMMGFILLGGTVINNAILLLGFVRNALKSGCELEEALIQSVRMRLKPILITTVSTILGLSPLVFEKAVGLERMSPLGIVASVGLLVGTILTLVLVPVVYASLAGREQPPPASPPL